MMSQITYTNLPSTSGSKSFFSLVAVAQMTIEMAKIKTIVFIVDERFCSFEV